MRERLMQIYLDDHWAGAGAGVALARRLWSNNRDTGWGSRLQWLAGEITDDEEALERLRQSLGMADSGGVKRAAAHTAEMLGRLKPNGRVVGYSPLSRVVEAEALMTGVAGKHRLWRSLRQVAQLEPSIDDGELSRLENRAEEQLELLREFHEAAARHAFVTEQEGQDHPDGFD